MPTLTHPKHELFAQALSKGSTQAESARQAGYDADHGIRLGRRKDIRRRVSELLGDVAMITKVDKAWVMTELQKNYERATETGDWSACNKSLELLGKELGMFVDKHEVDVQLKRRIIVERLTEEDAALMTALVRKIEAPDAE